MQVRGFRLLENGRSSAALWSVRSVQQSRDVVVEKTYTQHNIA